MNGPTERCSASWFFIPNAGGKRSNGGEEGGAAFGESLGAGGGDGSGSDAGDLKAERTGKVMDKAGIIAVKG